MTPNAVDINCDRREAIEIEWAKRREELEPGEQYTWDNYKVCGRGKYSNLLDLGEVLDWMHDECDLAKRYTCPMRVHIDVDELELHWRRDLPTSTQEEFWEYFRDSEFYKEWQVRHQRANKALPTIGRTKFLENICPCLKTPILDQCADPIYALVRVNLRVLRELLDAIKDEACNCNGGHCPCKDPNSRTNLAANSMDDYHTHITCDRVEFPALEIREGDPHACVPTFPKEDCATGKCATCGVLKIKVEGGSGPKEYEEKEITVFTTDTCRAYSTDKGNAQAHHTLMRDIQNYYVKGKLLHASNGWKDGDVLPIEGDGAPAHVAQLPGLTEMHIIHDGCKCQYVCAKAMQGNARFHQDTRRVHNEETMGTLLRTWKLEPYTGSSPVDSAGKDANERLRRHVAATGEDIDSPALWAEYIGSRSQLKSPPHSDGAHGDFAPNHYYHLSYDEADLKKLKLDGSHQAGVSSWSETVGGTASVVQGLPPD
jgi:hypothetical protein